MLPDAPRENISNLELGGRKPRSDRNEALRLCNHELILVLEDEPLQQGKRDEKAEFSPWVFFISLLTLWDLIFC